MRPPARIRLGISACLLGDKVRYDGGHKRDTFLTDVFGPLVEWVKVCPEVEVGMGTPREPIRLVEEGGRAFFRQSILFSNGWEVRLDFADVRVVLSDPVFAGPEPIPLARSA